MTTLYVRNFPERLYRRVQELAAAQQRSLGAQAVVLIDRALQQEDLKTRRSRALDSIARRRRTLRSPIGAADSLSLLREDRER